MRFVHISVQTQNVNHFGDTGNESDELSIIFLAQFKSAKNWLKYFLLNARLKILGMLALLRNKRNNNNIFTLTLKLCVVCKSYVKSAIRRMSEIKWIIQDLKAFLLKFVEKLVQQIIFSDPLSVSHYSGHHNSGVLLRLIYRFILFSVVSSVLEPYLSLLRKS